MAISPIDISMMQRMSDVAQIRQNEMTRPEVQQTTITQNIEKQVTNQSEQVLEQDNSNKSNTEHDAREKGKNTYFSSGKKKRKTEQQDRVTIKRDYQSFDMKI
ncbi:MAG: hypothetical protein ACI4GD_04510 [Lachnospiraceae bacterium]